VVKIHSAIQILAKRLGPVAFLDRNRLQKYLGQQVHWECKRPHRTKLGIWVRTQRRVKMKEQLDPDREKILEEIRFEWAERQSVSCLKLLKGREARFSADGAFRMVSHQEPGNSMAG